MYVPLTGHVTFTHVRRYGCVSHVHNLRNLDFVLYAYGLLTIHVVSHDIRADWLGLVVAPFSEAPRAVGMPRHSVDRKYVE